MSARKFWLGFNHVKGIGAVRLRALYAHFGSLEIAWHAAPADLQAAGLDQRSLRSLLESRRELDLDRISDQVDALGASVLTIEDPDYPARLQNQSDSPPVLYVKGTLLERDQWAVAFVGTRSATSYGRTVTRQLAGALAQSGVTIISGMALGIDAAAHRAAIEAGGRTFAVLGCGIDVVYPPDHHELAAAIQDHGALITEYPPGTPPESSHFPARNRIVSGLSMGVVVVEAPAKSGALITANLAADQGREVFAVPGNITNRNSQGTNRLIQEGATLVMHPDDILEELNLVRVPIQAREEVEAVAPANEVEASLLALLVDEPLHIDELCQLSELPITQVSSTLALMELKGIVQRVENMRYQITAGGGEHYRLD